MLNALRREWSEDGAGASGVAGLQDQLAETRRRLAEMAPRQIVADLERSLGHLAERISGLRREGQRERGLFPSGLARDEGLETYGVHDSKIGWAELERRIDALGVRLAAFSAAMVKPTVIESLRVQMQEVHDLLIAAAQRSVPLERVEGLIVDLADRVERLTAQSAQNVEPVRIAKPHAALDRQTGGATALSAQAPIDHRLGRARLGLERDAASPLDSGAEWRELIEAARRIDAALQLSQSTTARLESSLNALDTKFETVVGERFEALARDLTARLGVIEALDRERRAEGPILLEIVEKLNRLPVSETGQRPRDEAGAIASLDGRVMDSLAEELVKRIEGTLSNLASAATIPEGIALLSGRIETLASRIGDVAALERAARDLMGRLESTDFVSESRPKGAELVEQISALRQDCAAVDQRTESALNRIQDRLDSLVDCLPRRDDERQTLRDRPGSETDRSPGARNLDPAALAALNDVGPLRPTNKAGAATRHVETLSLPEFEQDVLLEPGADAPMRVQVSSSRTNPAVSAHIAAARRAAQSAVAANIDSNSPSGWPKVHRNIQEAGRFCVRHKRSIALAVVLALSITAVARLVSAYGPLMQKSESAAPPMKEATQAQPRAASPAKSPGAAPSAVDLAPTGSIGPDRRVKQSYSEPEAASPLLPAAVPSGVPAALREAALGGAPAAMYELAQRLFEGREAPRDQAASAFWFERAASGGFALAEFRLGAMYQKGVGVPRDLGAAKRWYRAAAEAGNARAAHNLAVISAEPAGDKADYAEAAKWFRRAAEMGVRDSQYNLAVLYARGLGVEQDLRQAWVWFSLAAQQGDEEAGRKRDEVAEKMDPAALAAAADQLSKVKISPPDPAVNDSGSSSEN